MEGEGSQILFDIKQLYYCTVCTLVGMTFNALQNSLHVLILYFQPHKYNK